MIELLKKLFESDNSYRKLWEEQNIELDMQKLRMHRKDKQIKKLELAVEKLEKEISVLKARRKPKRKKEYNYTRNGKNKPKKAQK